MGRGRLDIVARLAMEAGFEAFVEVAMAMAVAVAAEEIRVF